MDRPKRTGSSQQTDFKRRKGKVGKRAPKAQNLTNTSFQAASLRVAGPSKTLAAHSDDNALVSARGRRLPELISQLGHPASAVRLSAMKGLSNVVKHQPTVAIRPSIASVLESCAKSWVDDEEEVRNVSLSVFEFLAPRFDSGTISPFVLLLVAYIKSALNSLDMQMRIDGSRAVSILSRFHPSLVTPFVGTFVPAFNRILADRKGVNLSETALKALVSLLKCFEEDAKTCTSMVTFRPPDIDLEYLAAGGSRNALMVNRIQRWCTLTGKSTLCVADTEVSARFLGDETVTSHVLHEDALYDLLRCLRDLIVELNQESEFHQENRIDNDRTQLGLLLVDAVQLAWKRAKGAETKTNDKQRRMVCLSEHIISIVLDWLPSPRNASRVEEETSYTSICSLVLEVSSSASCLGRENPTEKEWIGRIQGHLLAQLASSQARSLDVLCHLVTFLDETDHYIEHLIAILAELERIFFQNDDKKAATSEATRKVVLLIERVIARRDYSLECSESPVPIILRRFVVQFPNYLLSWGADHCFESEAILSLLTKIARRSPDPSASVLISSFRANLSKCVSTPPSQKSSSPPPVSVFEQFPDHLQRMYLQVVVLIGSPSPAMLQNLAAINSRLVTFLQDELRDNIVACIHAVRKTVSMRDYLGFLLSSLGVPDGAKRSKWSSEGTIVTVDREGLLKFDSRIQCITLCLLRCDAKRCYYMLLPQLLSWLEPCSKPGDAIIRCRSSVSIMTVLLHAVRNQGTIAVLAGMPPSAIEHLASAYDRVLSAAENDLEIKSILLAPFLSLFRLDRDLLILVYAKLQSKFATNQFHDSNEALNFLKDLLKNAKVTGAEVRETVLSYLKSTNASDTGDNKLMSVADLESTLP